MANERSLPGLGIKGYADYKSDQWHLWADENWRKLSFLTSGWVKSRTTALPGSGTAGDVYIVKSDAGANANDVAIWDGAAGSEAWVYYTPQEGWRFWVRDEDKVYHFDGTAWVEFTSGGATSIDDLSDVDTTTSAPTTDQALIWNGSEWVPGDVAASGGGGGADAPGALVVTGENQASVTTGSWQTALLDAVRTNTISGASVDLGAETVTLPAGTYDIDAWISFWKGDTSQARIYSVTDTAEELRGNACYSDSAANDANSMSLILGRVTFTVDTTLRLEFWTAAGDIGNGAPDAGLNYAKMISITEVVSFSGITLDEGETLITSHDFGATPQSSVDFSMEGYDEVRIVEAGFSGSNPYRIVQLSPDGGTTIRTTGYKRWQLNDTSGGAESDLAGFYAGMTNGVDARFVLKDFARSDTPTIGEMFGSGATAALLNYHRYETSNEVHNWLRYKTNNDTNLTTGVVYIIGRKFGVAQRPAVRTVTASENFTAADAGNFVDGDTSGGAVTLTVVDSLFSIGDIIGGGNLGASALTIQFQAGTTINGTDAGSLSPTATTGEYSIRKRATNVWRGSAT